MTGVEDEEAAEAETETERVRAARRRWRWMSRRDEVVPTVGMRVVNSGPGAGARKLLPPFT